MERCAGQAAESSGAGCVTGGAPVGWAASGRNGGFCEASLTHGEENGRRRWPQKIDRLIEVSQENLDGIERAVADLGLDCGECNSLLKILDALGLGFAFLAARASAEQ